MDTSKYVKGMLYHKSSMKTRPSSIVGKSKDKSLKEGKDYMKLISKEVKEGEKVFTFIGSKEIKDRDGDIVVLDGMDINYFKENPVVLWGHDSSSTPIGKVVNLYRDLIEKELVFDIVFAPTEKGQEIQTLVEEGVLNATSIGFIVRDIDWKADTNVLLLTETELLEISIVNIPANPAALAKEDENEVSKSLSKEDVVEIVQELMNSTPEKEDKQEENPDIENPTEVIDAVPKEDVAPVETVTAEEGVEVPPETEKPAEIDYERLAQALLDAQAKAEPAPEEEQGEEKPEEAPSEEPVKEETEPEEVNLVSVDSLDDEEEFVIITQEED